MGNSPISGSTGAQNIWNLSSLTPTTPVDGTNPTSPGIFLHDGPAGPTTSSGSATRFELLMNSFERMLPSLSATDMQAQLLFATQNLQNQVSTNSQDSEVAEQAMQQAEAQEQQALQQQAIQEQQQAQQDAQGVSLWDKIKLAFQYLAAVVAIVVGAVLCATGAGAAVGALMIAGGVVGLITAVNSTLEATTGMGIAGNIAKDCGDSSTQIAQADEGFGIALAVVGVALAIASFGAGGGFSFFTAAEDVADVAVSATEIGVSAERAGAIASAIGNGVSGGTQILTGIGDGVAAGFNYQAQNDTAQSDRDQAQAIVAGAMADIITSLIKSMAQGEAAVFRSIAATMSQLFEAVSNTGTTIDNVAKAAAV